MCKIFPSAHSELFEINREKQSTHTATHVPVGQTLWLHVWKVVCKRNKQKKKKIKTFLLHHQRGCHGASPVGDTIIPHLLEKSEGGDLTADCSDARGTLRSPLIRQPLDFKEAAADNNQKLSSFWAATISVIPAIPGERKTQNKNRADQWDWSTSQCPRKTSPFYIKLTWYPLSLHLCVCQCVCVCVC